MLGYQVPEPDEAMLVSGGKGANGSPFRVVTGHGTFVLPLFRKARFLSLSMIEAEVTEACVTKQGIALSVRAVIAFKVGNDTESIVNAGQRFLSDQSQMSVLVGRIFAGHLRSIVGSMTVEEIVTERQRLAENVLEGSKEEMAKIGLTVDAFQIQSIDDMKLGYIAAMAAPHNAAIQRQAQIAQAQADQASAEADQQSKRAQAEYVRQTTIVQAKLAAEVSAAQAKANQDAAEAEQQSVRAQAEFTRQTKVVQAQYDSEVSVAQAKANQAAAQAEQESQRAQLEFTRQTSIVRAKAKAEVDKAESEASQSGPLAQATAQREVLAAQTELAARNADLRKQQLIAEVVKPAEAEAERIRVLAQADAERTRIQAEAAASNNRVSLDQLLIEQLPQIVREAAQGLAQANVTVLNGSDGLGEIASGLVSQGLAIFDSVRGGFAGGDPDDATPRPPSSNLPQRRT
ncbi:MAG: SPFH domain-containing protein [Jatrophihabitantaceae bacterium]